MSESHKNIKGLIASVANKDYQQANTFLQKTIENKLKERIQSSLAVKK